LRLGRLLGLVLRMSRTMAGCWQEVYFLPGRHLEGGGELEVMAVAQVDREEVSSSVARPPWWWATLVRGDRGFFIIVL